ncbi:MAG: cupin domain-containing protein [Acidimicrobiaceae bacterium]|nr:cupin domain-containing protein [Acidimicrobiaceae bacterium]
MPTKQIEIIRGVGQATNQPVLDVLGPTVEILTPLSDGSDGLCVMRGVVPPGVTVPLHSHDDPEDFYIVAGSQQILLQGENGHEWQDAHAGDYIRVPGGVPHAHRNVTDEAAIDLVFTTARIGHFFQDVGRPVTGPPEPPDPDQLANFVAAVARHGYTLATPEENAAVGIQLPNSSGRPGS